MKTDVQGFQIAFAFVDFDGSIQDENFVMEDYGEVKAFYKRWGEEGIQGTHYYDIETRSCSMAELGLDTTFSSSPDSIQQSLFWPINSNEKHDLIAYAPNMQCMDENLTIKGAYNSAKV